MKQDTQSRATAGDWKERSGEILRFLLTGGVCFAVELLTLILLRNGLKMDTLLATPIAFLVSVALNYLMCVTWVFYGAKGAGRKARIAFVVTSLIGLGLNELLMYLFRLAFGEDTVLFIFMGKHISMYMANKTLATMIVTVFNYFAKKRILNPPSERRG